MSEQNFQRDQNGPDNATGDDPLAELARIVAGKDAPAPRAAPAKPTIVPVSQDAQNAPQASTTETASALEISLRNENMDLESQLMAELGGGEPAPSAQPAEQLEKQPAPPEASTKHVAPTPVTQPEIAKPAQEPLPEPDFEAVLEQQLFAPDANGSDLPGIEENPGSDEIISHEKEAFQSAEQEMVAEIGVALAEVNLEPVAAPQTQISNKSEIASDDDLGFDAAFSSEIDDALQMEAPPQTALSQADAVSAPQQTQLQQPDLVKQQVVHDVVSGEPVENPQRAGDDELDIEASFSDAFADEFSLELDTIAPVTQVATPEPQFFAPEPQLLAQEESAQEPNVQEPFVVAGSTINYSQNNAPENQASVEAAGFDIQPEFQEQVIASPPQAPQPIAQEAQVQTQPAVHAEHEMELRGSLSDADAEHLETDQYQPEAVLLPTRRNSGFRMAAIALGLAVVAGVGVVGYSYVGEAENTGEPQIVRADQGEFKVKPDDPGGKVIANVNEPVYDAMAGNKSEESGQENLVVTNVEPINVEPDGVSGNAPKSAERLDSGNSSTAPNSAIAVMQPRKVKTVTVRADGTIITSAGNTLASLPGATPVADSNSVEGATTTGNIAIPSANPVKNLGATELALATPTTNNSTQVTAPVAAPSAPATRSITPPPTSSSPSSRPYVVQISSQRSMEAAEATYQNLKRRFASILDGQPKEIREAKVDGKGTFYRVRIPVGSQNDAANFCNRYKSAGGSCFVTR
ncbi:MAG: SPOR domain-containing protein [Rhizobiaceae bacterium]|nr:SPOR domain-containing protein [Rhizobiaceae bacterium]